MHNGTFDRKKKQSNCIYHGRQLEVDILRAQGQKLSAGGTYVINGRNRCQVHASFDCIYYMNILSCVISGYLRNFMCDTNFTPIQMFHSIFLNSSWICRGFFLSAMIDQFPSETEDISTVFKCLNMIYRFIFYLNYFFDKFHFYSFVQFFFSCLFFYFFLSCIFYYFLLFLKILI